MVFHGDGPEAMSYPRTYWRFSPCGAELFAGRDPLDLLADAETVKTNAVRKVFRSGGFFLKLDRRENRSFRGEFNAAMFCARQKVDAVEHLAWGRTPEGAWLITRDAEGFSEAAPVFSRRQNETLYGLLADFLRKIFESEIFHPDLHLGNVLVDPAAGRFTLVDLHGVRKKRIWDWFSRYMMQRCIMECRNALSDEEMIALVERCGIKNAESFFRKALLKEARLLELLQVKRRRQILSGYFKYTRLEGCGKLTDVNVEDDFFNDAESMVLPEAEDLFCFHFFLTQAKIPHRRIGAFDPVEKRIWIEKELPEAFCSKASAGELCRRLKHHRIDGREEEFSQGALHDIIGLFRNNN